MFKSGGWKPWEILAFGSLGVAGLVVAFMIFVAPEGEADWQEFAQKHHCVSVAKERIGHGSGYRCDDGEVHYRWRQQS
ncbi:hypothetical protein EWI61_12580 [Methylolobus aquaticus]|nr:hypothetical protein EWI61_12580 [Methylolobus aquaticus]